MICVRIALRFFLKSLILSVIMMMQLSVTIILANFLIGKYNALSDVLNITANFPGDDIYMYMPSLSDSESRGDKLEHLLDTYQLELTFEQPIDTYHRASDGTEYEMLALGDTTSRTLANSLVSGIWYTDATSSYVPCVTYADRALGEIIRLTIDNHLVEFQVVGTVSKNANIFTFIAASNKPGLEHMFMRSVEGNPRPLLLFNQADLPYEFDVIADTNALVYFHTDDTGTRERIIEEFRNIAWFVQLKEARIQSKDQLMIHVKTLAPMIVSIFFVGLVSTLCLTVLNSIRHMRIVSIYYISGMRWTSHLKAFVLYMLLQVAGVCSLIIAFFRFNQTSDMLPMDVVILNNLNLVTTIVTLIAIVMVALLAQMYIRKKETPIKYIKESW